MITTRNRRADLRNTCKQICSLRPPPDEILVCADGCSDGSADLIRTEFPGLLILENDVPLGSVASRDRMLHSATGDIVVSLDDDSYPLANDFFSRLGAVVFSHPEVAVIAFPELRDGGLFSDAAKADKSPGHYISAYANCAAAMRREQYLRQPGFPSFFVHMYEEPDYALQCYAAGSAVWFEPSLTIRHHVSNSGRDPMKRHRQNARNELWSVWMRCPWPWLPLVSVFRIYRQLRVAYAHGLRWVACEPLWWFEALAGTGKCLKARNPIAWPVYYAWMRLARKPLFALGDYPVPNLHSHSV